ncbi:CRAL/TRIO domain containing protein [Nitzschia inconspicua]|uniref:CRAL/TRIO domain containing protein n=1 Tax=Nitzschia inconspicua TaxID=303405 RepID=A0A9K3LLA6_9STRA|nr:CRAL/TRIO domain containing protein [Nitzschia inconspicua]
MTRKQPQPNQQQQQQQRPQPNQPQQNQQQQQQQRQQQRLSCSTIPSLLEVAAVETPLDILEYYASEYNHNKNNKNNNTTNKSNSNRQTEARWMIDQLSLEQQQVAAERNFSYWDWDRNTNTTSTTTATTNTTTTSMIFRKASAMQEALRHLEGISTKEMALDLLKATIQFHMDHQTTRYRTCFHTPSSKERPNVSVSLQQRIQTEIKHNQLFLIRGHDKDGHAILFAYPRRQNENHNSSSGGATDDDDAFVDTIVYMMERACAATEYYTRGRKDKVVVVIDTQGSVSPPSIQAAKRCVQILQTYYPGRLLQLVIWNPPFVLNALHKCIKPFLDPDTASKFVFCKGQGQIQHTMNQLFTLVSSSSQKHNNNNNNKEHDNDNEDAAPLFWNVSNVDFDVLLYKVPFYRAYDSRYEEQEDDDEGTTTTSTTSTTMTSTFNNNQINSSTLDMKKKRILPCILPRILPTSNTATTTGVVNAKTLAIGQLQIHSPTKKTMDQHKHEQQEEDDDHHHHHHHPLVVVVKQLHVVA